MPILLNQWNANDLFPTAEESLSTSKKALQGQIHPKTSEELILVLKDIEEAPFLTVTWFLGIKSLGQIIFNYDREKNHSTTIVFRRKRKLRTLPTFVRK